MNQRKPVWLLAIAIVSMLLLAIACDDDKPTEPTPPAELKDYVFYFNDAGYTDRYYRYFSESERADSLIIPYSSLNGLAVSADGSRLYLCDGSRTVVLSTDSFDVITEISCQSAEHVSVSPDNQYLAIIGDDIDIYHTADYTLLFHDTNDVNCGAFSADSRSFYCTGGGDVDGLEEPYVYRIDLSDSAFHVQRRFFDEGRPYRVLPSVDEAKWFLYTIFSNFVWAFEVYDVSGDSLIFRDILEPGAGDIEITADGRYVFYSNPGNFQTGPPPPSYFTVFDVDANEILKLINTEEYAETAEDYLPIGHLAITPDGRKLLGVQGPSGGEMIVVDVATMEIESHINLGRGLWLWDATCQNGL